MSVARLAARAVIGGLFIGHGTQKLFGWFGGPGRAGTAGMMETLEMRPAPLHALAAGVTETSSGALLAAGLGTPLAAAGITGVMTTAIRKVHLRNGPWIANGGWEYNAVLIAALAALVEVGPGKYSLDHVLGIDRHGTAIALAAVGLGVTTAGLTMAAGRRGAPAPLPPGGDKTAQAAQSGVAGDPTVAGAQPSGA